MFDFIQSAARAAAVRMQLDIRAHVQVPRSDLSWAHHEPSPSSCLLSPTAYAHPPNFVSRVTKRKKFCWDHQSNVCASSHAPLVLLELLSHHDVVGRTVSFSPCICTVRFHFSGVRLAGV